METQSLVTRRLPAGDGLGLPGLPELTVLPDGLEGTESPRQGSVGLPVVTGGVLRPAPGVKFAS
ncbi:hypothetical protein [Knoellia subterranea]|uniref:Uncharacterized protein n=1 Tax=Knoellia subterranea KCTC 19937 TaxID=1385521 RepID=A0A0A0JIQ1_9MICO|nr:hypothetical protein [Knoellia subterranea]KGN37300.1 hypothetical protein N803_15345 [Knoellia subterranea KCTC 19937]